MSGGHQRRKNGTRPRGLSCHIAPGSMPGKRWARPRDAISRHQMLVSTNERTAMNSTLHDLLIAVGALSREPRTREHWLSDGDLRIRLMPMDPGWQPSMCLI
jgi:hypothetical protein